MLMFRFFALFLSLCTGNVYLSPPQSGANMGPVSPSGNNNNNLISKGGLVGKQSLQARPSLRVVIPSSRLPHVSLHLITWSRHKYSLKKKKKKRETV